MASILISCSGGQNNSPTVINLQELPPVQEYINIDFGFQGRSARIYVDENENTINIRNLYNIANPLAEDRTGTVSLGQLPSGFETDLMPHDFLVIEDPVGTNAVTVKLGEFRIAEGTIAEPLGGNMKKYTVWAEFAETSSLLLPTDIMVTYETGVPGYDVVSETATISITNTQIVIAELTNPPKTYAVRGEIKIVDRLGYFTTELFSTPDQSIISFGDRQPTNTHATHLVLDEWVDVTNLYTQIVTRYEIEIRFEAKAYLGFNASDMTAVFETMYDKRITNSGAITITGTHIVVSGLTNEKDDRLSYFRVGINSVSERRDVVFEAVTIPDSDPSGLNATNYMTDQTFVVTNLFDNTTEEYTLELNFIARPPPELITNTPSIYMTEVYQKSSKEFVVEIYVEDIPDLGQGVFAFNYGVRSFSADIDPMTSNIVLAPAASPLANFDFWVEDSSQAL